MSENCNCPGMNPCGRNHRHEHFERDVATWKTVRHYDVDSHDTIHPVCTEGLRNERLEDRIEDHCTCRPERIVPFDEIEDIGEEEEEEGENGNNHCPCRRKCCCPCRRNCCRCGGFPRLFC